MPADQVVHGARFALDAQRSGWNALGLVEPGDPNRLAGVGRAGLSEAVRAVQRDFQRYGASLARSAVISPRLVARLEGAWMAGSDLDRFSRYTFGTFDNRLRGYPSALIRYDRGGGASKRARLVRRQARARGRISSTRPRCTIRASAAGCATTLASARRARGAGAVRHAGRGRVGLRLARRQRRTARSARKSFASAATRCFESECTRGTPCARVLSSLACSPRSSPRSRAQQTFRTEVDLVHFGVVVTDKQGAPITGLTADDFEVMEEGKPQTIKFFAAGDPETAPPLHLGFLLDTSGSMEEDIKDVRTAAIKFLNTMDRRSTSRWSTSTPRCGWRATAAADYPRLIERIRGREAGWLHRALRRARRVSQRRRRPDRAEDPDHVHRRRRHAQRPEP